MDNVTKEQPYYCLALTLVPGLGTVRIHRLLRVVKKPSRVFAMKRSELKALGMAFEARAFILSGRAAKEADRALDLAKETCVNILTMFDDEYPVRLSQISDPPLALYCKGRTEFLGNPSIAIVGSRRCSVYGREVTQMLARELSGFGLTIVSGLARGVDTMAHVGTLAANGDTIAVLGNGIDVVYPKENRKLYARIADHGCLITEFRNGQYPAPQNFPIRNRIISGLGLGTVITEASEFSGSLITARLTLEQDREVWAVPGNILNPGSYGPNYLIKQGARPVLTPQDVLDELPLFILEQLREVQPETESKAQGTSDDEEDKVLALLIADASIQFDQLVVESGMSAPQLNRVMLQLEMKGLVSQDPGRRYSRRLL